MLKLIKTFNKPYIFPLTYILLHVFTYGTYFFIANQDPVTPWLDEKKIGVTNLVWFNSTYWPNLAGLFVIYHLFYKRRCSKLALCYLFALLAEQFFIGADYMGSYDGLPLAKASFGLFSTKLNFLGVSGGNAINHFSIWVALIHFMTVVFKMLWSKHAYLGRYLRSK
jgi:hypothetical protein